MEGRLEPDERYFRRRASEELAAARRAVTDAARERRVELIVVGSRQRSLVRHLLFDGLADELVVEAAADVLVVR